MSGNGRCIGHDDMIAHHAIVGDVRVGEQNVVIAEDGPFAFLGTRVNADVFAENIFRTDFEAGFAGSSFQILSTTTNESVREDFAVGSELGKSFDGGVVMNCATIGEGDIGTDECVSANRDVVPDFRA